MSLGGQPVDRSLHFCLLAQWGTGQCSGVQHMPHCPLLSSLPIVLSPFSSSPSLSPSIPSLLSISPPISYFSSLPFPLSFLSSPLPHLLRIVGCSLGADPHCSLSPSRTACQASPRNCPPPHPISLKCSVSLGGFQENQDVFARVWGSGRACSLILGSWLPPVYLDMIGAGCRTGQDRARLGANAKGQSVQSEDWCHKKGQALP